MTYAQIIERAINNFDSILEELKEKGLTMGNNVPVEQYHQKIKKYLFMVDGLSEDEIELNSDNTIDNYRFSNIQLNVYRENNKAYIKLNNPGYYDKTIIELIGSGDNYEKITIEPVSIGLMNESDLNTTNVDDLTVNNTKTLNTANKVINNDIQITIGDWAMGEKISNKMDELRHRLCGMKSPDNKLY